jgi:hypothetical protein
VIAIENKINCGPHNPFEKYENSVREQWPDYPPMFVYLTPAGMDLPDREHWVAYSYRRLHGVLARLRNTHQSSIGEDVSTFLDHYLQLVGAHLMENPEITSLCKRLYQNHRRAIDLVWEFGRPTKAGVEELQSILRGDPRFEIIKESSKSIEFIPVPWKWMPPRESFEGTGRPWIKWFVVVDTTVCYVSIEVGPSNQQSKRLQLIELLRQHGEPFGIKLKRKITGTYTRLCSVNLVRWDEDQEVPVEEISTRFRKVLDELYTRFVSLPEALRPMFDEWKALQPVLAQ